MKKTSIIISLIFGIIFFSACSSNENPKNYSRKAEVQDLNKKNRETIEKQNEQNIKDTIENKKISDSNIPNIKKYEENIEGGYQLRQLNINTWEQELIKIDPETGKEIVIIPNIKDTLPELKKDSQLALKKFALPKDSSAIVFKSVLMETDNPRGDLYFFDTKDNTFEKMKINDGFFDGFALSPDNTKFALIAYEDNLDKILFICDLLKDNCEERVRLSNDNETFNAGTGAMLNLFEIEWIGNSQIKYSVFDETKKQYELGGENKDIALIEFRYLDI